eukprot:12425286-Karenia_brevis.AAC.1
MPPAVRIIVQSSFNKAFLRSVPLTWHHLRFRHYRFADKSVIVAVLPHTWLKGPWALSHAIGIVILRIVR